MDIRTHIEEVGSILVPTGYANPSVAGHGPIFAIHNNRLYRLVPVDVPNGEFGRTAEADWAVRNGWPECTRPERVNAWISNMWYIARERAGHV